jgi:two-component system sensor histidine kinase PilS (NtrC family)
MNTTVIAPSWFEPIGNDRGELGDDPHEFSRLWQALMGARLAVGLLIMLLQVALYVAGTTHSKTLVAVGVAYFAATLLTRTRAKPHPLGASFSGAWGAWVGVDVLAFALLHVMHGSSINYTPLFALPILLASILGSLRLALATAAGVTLLLLSESVGTFLRGPGDAAPYFVQNALSGTGYFVIAFLANQLATRLASEAQRARQSQLAANIQRQVNELVIESLADGILIVDNGGVVRAANPAARDMLGMQSHRAAVAFDLKAFPRWAPLWDFTRLSLGTGLAQEQTLRVDQESEGPRSIFVRTRLAAPIGSAGQSLCVLFLQDQRELEARMRTEKLASMGRLSTAVAHEIRNPLAAIVQANALLDEDINDPKFKQLIAMIGNNAKRLERTVDDILKVSRIQTKAIGEDAPSINISEHARFICAEWTEQILSAKDRVFFSTSSQALLSHFDGEHLRRVLVNLLDNANRYASNNAQSIQILCETDNESKPKLSVWSDGAPLDQSVERHLFEPFFSSESRSSGMGLFICRELCARHGASLSYQRKSRTMGPTVVAGNNFAITFGLIEPAASEVPQ